MTNHPFRNDASYAERAEMHRQEKLRAGDHAPTTLHQMANRGVDLSLDGGQAPGGYVTGSEPEAQWPQLPPGSPWGNGPSPGLEPSLSVEIDQQEPCGTPSEVSASLAALAVPTFTAGVATPPAAPLSVASPDDAVRGGVAISPEDEAT